jgi:hypothetical protein
LIAILQEPEIEDATKDCAPLCVIPFDARPYGLWSLLEMYESNAQEFISAVKTLDHIALLMRTVVIEHPHWPWASQMTPDMNAPIRTAVEEFRTSCINMGARAPADSARRTIELLEKPATYAQMDISIQMTSSAFYDEMRSWHLIVLNESESLMYGSGLSSIDATVLAKFAGIEDDMDEAYKCAASGRPTASVFHLMRVMERAIRAWATSLRIPSSRLNPSATNLRELMWNEIEGEIRQEIGNLPRTTPPEVAVRQQEEAALASLVSIRTAWRNPTMHPASKYTESQSKMILNFVAEFLPELAKVL